MTLMKMLESQIHELSRQLGQLLHKHGLSVSTAESCTGGLIAGAITEIAGSSGWFEQGWVTYSNEAKHQSLAVTTDVLEQMGAVSEDTVLEMASGALARSGAEIAIAVSGIAGPDGGSAEKPVGTVWIGWALQDGHSSAELFHYDGDRRTVRLSAVADALRGTINRVNQTYR